MRKTTVLVSTSLILAYAATASAGVTGTVTLSGKAPAPADIKMDQDPKCKEMNKAGAKSDDYVVAGDKLAHVLVYLKNPPKGDYKAPATKVSLDQKGCMYTPKVFGIMVKQKLEIINSDPTLHNIHAFAKRGEFNVGMPKQGQKIEKDFKKAEMPVSIKCDVHPWMQAWVGVMEHPFFATTDASGKFTMPTDGLADGEYEVVAWHPKAGETTGKVKVAGGNGTVDFTLAAK